MVGLWVSSCMSSSACSAKLRPRLRPSSAESILAAQSISLGATRQRPYLQRRGEVRTFSPANRREGSRLAMRFPPSCRSAQAKECECPPLSWASSSLRQQPNSVSAPVPVACIASTARTPLAVFRRAPLNAWLCSTPRGGSKRVGARKVKSTHVSRHRWVWKAAGVVAYHLRRQVFWAIASALRM